MDVVSSAPASQQVFAARSVRGRESAQRLPDELAERIIAAVPGADLAGIVGANRAWNAMAFRCNEAFRQDIVHRYAATYLQTGRAPPVYGGEQRQRAACRSSEALFLADLLVVGARSCLSPAQGAQNLLTLLQGLPALRHVFFGRLACVWPGFLATVREELVKRPLFESLHLGDFVVDPPVWLEKGIWRFSPQFVAADTLRDKIAKKGQLYSKPILEIGGLRVENGPDFGPNTYGPAEAARLDHLFSQLQLAKPRPQPLGSGLELRLDSYNGLSRNFLSQLFGAHHFPVRHFDVTLGLHAAQALAAYLPLLPALEILTLRWTPLLGSPFPMEHHWPHRWMPRLFDAIARAKGIKHIDLTYLFVGGAGGFGELVRHIGRLAEQMQDTRITLPAWFDGLDERSAAAYERKVAGLREAYPASIQGICRPYVSSPEDEQSNSEVFALRENYNVRLLDVHVRGFYVRQ